MDRITAIKHITKHLKATDVLLSTTGMISREVFFVADRACNFYMIGSMGLLSSFGLGLAMLKPHNQIIVLDGDGSVLMSLGTVPLISYEKPSNYHHIVIDNQAYQSTGGQPTIAESIDIAAMVRASGYKSVYTSNHTSALDNNLEKLLSTPGPNCLHIQVDISEVPNIPRVSHSPTAIRDRFYTSFLVE